MMFRFSVVLLSLWTACAGMGIRADDPINFESQIRPLLIRHCGSCHGPEEQKSSLRLDARHAAFRGGDGGPVIISGKSGDSELFRRITSSSDDDRMPPEGDPLSDAEVQLIQQWLDEGAEWPETDYDRKAAEDPRLKHWAFQQLLAVTPPDVSIPPQFDGLAPTDIDRFVWQTLEESGLTANSAADKLALIRRATLDLTGLPPTPERVRQYVNTSGPDAWPALIEELLASPHFGERWAQHWLDVVRYADTHGFEVNTSRDNAWPYRDYVIRSFNDDKPYDQFVREQIAGDVFGSDEATGFLVAAAVLLPGQIGADDASKRLARQDALDELIVGTGGTFLGITVGCARCHDHKFDPITQEDYYSMQAFFAGVEYGDRPVRDSSWNARMQDAAALEPQIERLQRTLQEFEPLADTRQILIIDEEDPRAVFLKQPNGPGANPEGTKRGYRDDPGSAVQPGNLSRGRYTWWNNVAGEDVMTWSPGVSGTFHIWLSWGAHGSGVHTRDARYLIDQDGDLNTREDQQEIARIDQYYQAGVSEGTTEQTPLWSGFLSVGEHSFQPESRILLRGGDTGTGITADVIVLQESSSSQALTGAPALLVPGVPALRAPGVPALRAPVVPGRNVELFPAEAAKYVRFTTFATINDNQHEPCLDELEIFAAADPQTNIALAVHGAKASSSGNYSDIGIHQLPHIHDGLYGNDQSWISDTRGGGWVQIELPEVTSINRIEWGRDRTGKFLDRLAVKYEISVSTDGGEWRVVARSDDRCPQGTPFDPVQALIRGGTNDVLKDGRSINIPELVAELNRLQSEKTQLETPRQVFAGIFREPDPTYVLRRGDPKQKVREIEAAVPTVFARISAQTDLFKSPSADGQFETVAGSKLTIDQQRRVQLAEWIASADNPLTARVIVNRIWQGHFGRGLVETPSDFGVNGVPPSHPELLDWLASELIQSGWSLKHIHRLIMLSATYRLSSTIDSTSAAKDRDNRLLWRYSSRRLESEAVRDCTLAVTGELNPEMGGPGFSFFKTRGGLDGFPPIEEFTPREMRRMIYSHKVRMEPVPVFGAFDCPDAGQSMPRRSRSTTAIQALNLLNSPFVVDRGSAFAKRLEAENPGNTQQQLNNAFELTMGRMPKESEREACMTVVDRHGLETVCRVLLNSSEFLFIP